MNIHQKQVNHFSTFFSVPQVRLCTELARRSVEGMLLMEVLEKLVKTDMPEITTMLNVQVGSIGY